MDASALLLKRNTTLGFVDILFVFFFFFFFLIGVCVSWLFCCRGFLLGGFLLGDAPWTTREQTREQTLRH